MVRLISIILIALAIIAFSIQNVSDLEIFFLAWRFNLSVSTLMVVSVMTGIVLTQLLRALVIKRQARAKNRIAFVGRR
jgi:uncharacterized integral membrane protein